MKRFPNLAVFGLVLLLVSAACASDETPSGGPNGDGGNGSQTSNDLLAQIQERGYMNVGVSVYAPYIMLDQDNQAIGIFPEMSAEIGKRLGGIEVNHVFLTASSFIPALDSGRIDTLSGYSFTDERAEVADFSDPVMFLPDCFMVGKSSGISTIEGLNGRVIALTRGSLGEANTLKWIEEGVFEPSEIRTYDTFQSPVDEIVNGRVDGGYWDVVGFEYGAQQNPETFSQIDCIPIPPELIGGEAAGVFYLFAKGEDARMLEEVNGIIADMQADGTMAEIFSHFGLTDPALVTGFG